MLKDQNETEFKKAIECWKGGQLDQALTQLTTCEKSALENEDKAEILAYKGWVLKEKGKVSEAQKAFDEALSLSTDAFVVAYSLHGLGSCFLNDGHFVKATHLYERAVNLYNSLKGARYRDYRYSCILLLVHGYLVGDNIERALRLEQEMSIAKKTPDWFLSDYYAEIGHYYYKRNRFETSALYYEKAVPHAKESQRKGDLLFYLGSSFYLAGNENKGIPILREALKFLKNDEFIKATLKYLAYNP